MLLALMTGCSSSGNQIFELFRDGGDGVTQAYPIVDEPYGQKDKKDDVSCCGKSIDVLIAEGSDEANRNKVLFSLIAKSDINCSRFMGEVYRFKGSSNLLLGTATTALAGAAAIVGGAAAQNFAGAAAVTNYTHTKFNEEFYEKQLISSIAKEITTSRNKAYQAIKENSEKEISEYSSAEAVRDAIEYNQMCSIPFALQMVLTKADKFNSVTCSSAEQVKAIDDNIAKVDATKFNPEESEESKKDAEIRYQDLMTQRIYYSKLAATCDSLSEEK